MSTLGSRSPALLTRCVREPCENAGWLRGEITPLPIAGSVIAVGGAEDKLKKRAILSEFVRSAGDSQAIIVIFPTASMMPRERGDLYAGIFREMGAARVEVLDIETREAANDPSIAARVREATGIFVTGGVQLRLISILGGTLVNDAMNEVIARGGVYCGTSAGAAVVSSHMIVTGRRGMLVRRGMVDLAPGLGLVDNVIIDQHFSQRGRLGRLIAAIGMNPRFMGIGIDEDTAAIFRSDGEFDVVGGGQVAIVDASKVSSSNVHSVERNKPFTMVGLQLHLLTAGDRFNLRSRSMIPAGTPVVVPLPERPPARKARK